MNRVEWSWKYFRPCADHRSQLPAGCDSGKKEWGYCPCKIWSEGVNIRRAKFNYGYITDDNFETWISK